MSAPHVHPKHIPPEVTNEKRLFYFYFFPIIIVILKIYSGGPALEELTQEDTHYSQTVSTILQHQSTRWSDSSTSAAAAAAGRLPNVLLPILILQVESPSLRPPPLRSLSRRRHLPVAPQIHPLLRPIPPHKVPRQQQQLPQICLRRRQRLRLPIPQNDAAGRAQRQPRPRRAPPPRKTQRAVHHLAIARPFRYQNGQGLDFR